MKNTGKATPQATCTYLGVENSWVRKLGKTNLSVGALGFGTYRVDQGDPAHEQALRRVLDGGHVNLIDTACNYTGGQSEELIGRVFGEFIASGKGLREAFVFVTKAGYLTDELLAHARAGGVPEDSISKLGEDHWHSFDPLALDEAIPRSLDRLGLTCIDVFLIHNPEYFLKSREAEPLMQLRDDFYRRVEAAFECLEKWVQKGAIGSYGISSNTLGFPPEDRHGTSLERFVLAAENVASKNHHFRVVQAPLNLLERDVLTTLSNTDMGVLTNRPLNAIENGSVYRLSQDFSLREAMEFRERARALRHLERVFKRGYASQCSGLEIRTVFFVNELARGLGTFPTRVSLADYMTYTHMPRIRRLFTELDAVLANAEGFSQWRDQYWSSLLAFVRSAMAQLEQRDMEKLAPIFRALEEQLPEKLQETNWAQRAWWFCSTQPGVSSVLVGARQPKYVEDIHDLALRWDE